MAGVWVGDNQEEFRRTIFYSVDENYIPTLGMELIAGNNFTENIESENDKAIVNEAFVKIFGLAGNPVGQTINQSTNNEGGRRSLTIIGVIKDFHFRSLHEAIAPLVMLNNPTSGLILKTKTTEMADLIASINEKWQAFQVEEPFTYALLDELYNETYLAEQKMGNVLQIFGFITIFVACLGLFGLVTFTTEQRVKEIGIRKVLGADVFQIVSILSKDLLLLVAISFVIAIPLGIYLMEKWLQGFEYRIDVHVWVFILAGISTLLIALFTMSFKTIKASLSNPVDSLRSE
jgi:putative ABC transport system permease protein